MLYVPSKYRFRTVPAQNQISAVSASVLYRDPPLSPQKWVVRYLAFHDKSIQHSPRSRIYRQCSNGEDQRSIHATKSMYVHSMACLFYGDQHRSPRSKCCCNLDCFICWRWSIVCSEKYQEFNQQSELFHLSAMRLCEWRKSLSFSQGTSTSKRHFSVISFSITNWKLFTNIGNHFLPENSWNSFIEQERIFLSVSAQWIFFDYSSIAAIYYYTTPAPKINVNHYGESLNIKLLKPWNQLLIL